jgi:hypothetical protein
MMPFTCHGHWWLPTNSTQRIAGILDYSPDEGTTLDLKGTFSTQIAHQSPLGLFQSYPIINGITEHGKPFTLHRCFQTGSHLGSHAPATSQFDVAVAIEGCHFQCEEDVVFDEISVNYPLLDEWAFPIKYTPFSPAVIEGGRRHWTVSYSTPESTKAHINSLTVTFGTGLKSSMGLGGFNVTAVPTFVFASAKPMPLNYFLADAEYVVRCLIILGLGQGICPHFVAGKNTTVTDVLPNNERLKIDLPIYMGWGQAIPSARKLSRSNVLFDFAELTSNFEQYLRNWFDRMASLRPVCDLLFGTLTNSQMFVQHAFLSLSQALETYHRRTRGGKYVENTEWEGIQPLLIAALPTSMSSEFRTSLTQKFKYLAEFSLRKRLMELCGEYEAAVGSIIGDTKKFVGLVVDNRNYLTHYDQNLVERYKSDDLYQLSQRMRCLLEACLLSEIGMDKIKIAAIIAQSSRYEYLRQPVPPDHS